MLEGRFPEKWARIAALAAGLTLVDGAFGYIHPLSAYAADGGGSVAVAGYERISTDEFRKVIRAAFEASHFSLDAIDQMEGGVVDYRFSYPVSTDGVGGRIRLLIHTDEHPDGRRRCSRCFLRGVNEVNLSALPPMGLMDGYALRRKFLQDIDAAYGKINLDAARYKSRETDFSYENKWQGERNVFGNSYVGIGLTDLSGLVVKSYVDAGFKFLREIPDREQPNLVSIEFSFPVGQEGDGGVVYRVSYYFEQSVDKLCYPCEVRENYDPHQPLPAMGLRGMADRLTLESRFSEARSVAIEKMRRVTGPYLRPGTVFTAPPKPAPLGSPRPKIFPVVT